MSNLFQLDRSQFKLDNEHSFLSYFSARYGSLKSSSLGRSFSENEAGVNTEPYIAYVQVANSDSTQENFDDISSDLNYLNDTKFDMILL